jgi:hypothetical protein
MASLDEAFNIGSLTNNSWNNREKIIQTPQITQHNAANIIADQHRFPVTLLKAKTPSNIDGCYHFVNIKNGYDYCYKY